MNTSLKIVGICYALSALNMFLQNITQLAYSWHLWSRPAENYPSGMRINFKLASVLSLVVPTIIFVISMLVIFKSEKIVSLIKKENEAYDNPMLDSLPILNISIKLFGLFALLSSIPQLSEFLGRLWILRLERWPFDNQFKIALASSGICALLYIGVGVLLILYSDYLAEMILEAGSRKGVELQSD